MSDGIQEQRSGTQGLEIELQDPSHLFRHASEITKGNKKSTAVSYAYYAFQPCTILIFYHLWFYYFTETKGGYLQGKIYLPREKPQDGDGTASRKCSNYFLRVSLGPANIEPELNPFHIHPLLLYLNTRQNRRKRQSKVNNYWECNGIAY